MREELGRSAVLLILTTVAAGAFAALGGCGQGPVIYVDHGYVRLAAVPDRPAVGYFTLHGGASNATLIAVSTEVAIRSEMHRSMTTSGVASMQPIARLALPARGSIAFAPGGRHLMLFNVNSGIKPGKSVPLLFTFGDGERIIYDAPAIAAGDAAPRN